MSEHVNMDVNILNLYMLTCSIVMLTLMSTKSVEF
jgi:hypothetical protein